MLLVSMGSNGDILQWTVSEDATVDGIFNLYTFMSPIPDDEFTNPAGRVKVSGGGLTSPIYLDNYIPDEDTSAGSLDVGGGYYGIYVGDDGSGRYGINLMQAHVPSELAMEVLFSIELGRMDWDDDTYMSGIFTVLAESDQYTYEQVRQHMYPTFDLNPPVTDWKPLNFHSIPEPSSSLLLLMGIGLLALRRGHGDC